MYNLSNLIKTHEINLNGNVVAWSEHIKYLDELLDHKLTFGEHAKHTWVKALWCIRLVYPSINRKSKLSSRNEATVWGGCDDSHSKLLQVAHNKSSKPYCLPTLKLHEDSIGH